MTTNKDLLLAVAYLEQACSALERANKAYMLDYTLDLAQDTLMAAKLIKIAAQTGRVRRERPKPSLSIVV